MTSTPLRWLKFHSAEPFNCYILDRANHLSALTDSSWFSCRILHKSGQLFTISIGALFVLDLQAARELTITLSLTIVVSIDVFWNALIIWLHACQMLIWTYNFIDCSLIPVVISWNGLKLVERALLTKTAFTLSICWKEHVELNMLLSTCCQSRTCLYSFNMMKGCYSFATTICQWKTRTGNVLKATAYLNIQFICILATCWNLLTTYWTEHASAVPQVAFKMLTM